MRGAEQDSGSGRDPTDGLVLYQFSILSFLAQAFFI